MNKFEVKEEFKLNDEDFKIVAGAIHYFRILPEDWYHSLYNLKAMGCNTLETYIPWNFHEVEEGKYNFSGNHDIVKFVKIAEELGLLVILRPTPYICAEWEFGGLPAWLLNYKNMRIRSNDPLFIEKVDNYYSKLIPLLTPLQISNGGPVIMMQVENEYGSYSNEKAYLKTIKDIMIKYGVTVPLFTSDGPWEIALEAGSMIEEDILVTGNFGSRAKDNFSELKKFHERYAKKWPMMCMEFWDGWFNRWDEEIIRRDAQDLADCTKELLELGSLNFYMFHGGTNFGFMNGCSARIRKDLPQITSYDYDAILNEQGNPTDKFYKLQKVIKDVLPLSLQVEPLIKKSISKKNIKLKDKVSLFSVIEDISDITKSTYPMTMEELKSPYGYVMYRANLSKKEKENIRIIDASDRIQLFVNQKYQITQYRDEIGETIVVELEKDNNSLEILVENLGRVNYGSKLLADTQRKGIRTGVMRDLHFHTEWEQLAINFSNYGKIDFSKEWNDKTPAFYSYEFDLEEVEDTFIDMSNFGKGILILNGFNLGRYWEVGPVLSLYVSKHLLKEKNNEIIVFETEGKYQNTISLSEKPVYRIFNKKEEVEE